MPERVFVDTSAIFAWASVREERHVAAVEEFRRLREEGRSAVLTTDIFDEAVTLLMSRCGHAIAVSVGSTLRDTSVFRIIDVDPTIREQAWSYFCRHADHPLSLTDCTSIVTMRRAGITEVFSFDTDFDRVGLVRRPR